MKTLLLLIATLFTGGLQAAPTPQLLTDKLNQPWGWPL